MIKAEYRGLEDNPLHNGKTYKISTRCTGSKMIVSVRNVKRVYTSLEKFLKEWKIKAVYHE